MKHVMKWMLLIMVLFAWQEGTAQLREALDIHREHEINTWKELIQRGEDHTNDTSIDVKFYHLDLEIAIDSSYISGSVRCLLLPAEGEIEELFLDLDASLTVTAVSEPCESYYQDENKIFIDLDDSYGTDDFIDLTIQYEGVPVKPGGIKGLRYETHHGDEPIIVTLSTPFLAHYWYPCKDGPEDKADSVYVDITIDKQKVNDFEVIAVSNGLLEDTVSAGDKKTFKWRHRYPIVTYYVMAAISNFATIEETYDDNEGTSFPLQYFVFAQNLPDQEMGVQDIPEVISFFNDIFGMYPFANEKFGMTQLGFYGAIENQTNVIQNSLSQNWFLVSVHELAHMWFGDMITCETWNHGWLNEGFATYSEALWVEYITDEQAYHTYMNGMQYWGPGTIYLPEVEDPFNVFIQIIYQKGAWALHMLRGVVGDSLFFESLKDYAESPDLMYGHASTSQFQEIVENNTGLDLDNFFDQWIYDEYYPLYGYNYVQDQAGMLTIGIYQAQEEIYGRRPVFEMPLEILIEFTDGSDSVVVVQNTEQLQYFHFNLAKTVDDISLDPERWILRETYFFEELPVGIDLPENFREIYVYPNPANDQLFVNTNSQTPLSFELIDLTGQIVLKKSILSKNDVVFLGDLTGHFYLYRIRDGNGTAIQTGKVVVK